MPTNDRLESAIQKMKPRRTYKNYKRKNGETPEDWDVQIRKMHADNPDFFKQVYRAKNIILSYGDHQKLSKPQDATSLRLQLEREIDGYFGKPMLAVALVELGFSVIYKDPFYFSSNFRSSHLSNKLRKIRWAEYVN